MTLFPLKGHCKKPHLKQNKKDPLTSTPGLQHMLKQKANTQAAATSIALQGRGQRNGILNKEEAIEVGISPVENMGAIPSPHLDIL